MPSCDATKTRTGNELAAAAVEPQKEAESAVAATEEAAAATELEKRSKSFVKAVAEGSTTTDAVELDEPDVPNTEAQKEATGDQIETDVELNDVQCEAQDKPAAANAKTQVGFATNDGAFLEIFQFCFLFSEHGLRHS